jgi:hypothetical protein
MERALKQYLELAELSDELAFVALKGIGATDLDVVLYQAHSALMARTLTDLRAACQLAVSGYTMQSWSVAASCFEAAHSIGYIGSDSARATRWVEHSDRHRAPWGAKDAVQNAIIFLSLEADTKKRQELVDREYSLYETLCIAKHVNPIAEKFRYFYRRDTFQVLRLSPVSTHRRIAEAKKGLIVAIRCTSTGIWALLDAHHQGNEALRRQLIAIMETTDSLVQELVPVSGDTDAAEPTDA